MNFAGHMFRGRDDGALAIQHASEHARAVVVDLGRACVTRRRASAPAWSRSESGRATASSRYLPNIPETIAAFLATASLGAIWSSAAPEFGARA